MAKEKNKTELPKVMEGELQARLIKLREDAGLDVSQMADALCLSEDVINNLENEAFDLLAEPPYVRGYLRNYAKLGDEDASELISRYESLRGADVAELDFQIKSTNIIDTSSKKQLSPVWGQVILLGILLGGIGLLSTIPAVNTWVTTKWENLSSQLKPSNSDNNPSLLGELPVPAPLPGDIATETSNPTNQQTAPNNDQLENTSNTENLNTATQNAQTTSLPNTSTDSTSESQTAESTTEPVTNENNTETAESVTNTETNQAQTNETEVPSSTSSSNLINIKLVFNNEVWLRIKNKDNKTVFEGLNKAATEKTIELEKPLTFRVGNAQGLSLFIDNKAVDISTYINGSIANFTLE